MPRDELSGDSFTFVPGGAGAEVAHVATLVKGIHVVGWEAGPWASKYSPMWHPQGC